MIMIRLVVIKVGGSLFDWPELPRQLTALLDDHSAAAAHLLLIPGGGRAADFVRSLDRTFALGDVPAHHLALRSLDLTAQVLAVLVPGLVVIDQLATLPQLWKLGRTPVLAPRRFLEEIDCASPDSLPPSWEVTSDAIAARVAVHLRATELILLKSAPLPAGSDRRAAARLGLVDRCFPDVSRKLSRVIYTNIRSDPREPILLND
jgi:aspartokinase-like uncharacterized kinase